MSEPLGPVVPLVRLRQRVAAALGAHGLVLVRLMISPGEHVDGPHEVQVVAMLADDWKYEEDDGFEAVLDSTRQADIEAAADEVRAQLAEDLRDRLDGGDGVL